MPRDRVTVIIKRDRRWDLIVNTDHCDRSTCDVRDCAAFIIAERWMQAIALYEDFNALVKMHLLLVWVLKVTYFTDDRVWLHWIHHRVVLSAIAVITCDHNSVCGWLHTAIIDRHLKLLL